MNTLTERRKNQIRLKEEFLIRKYNRTANYNFMKEEEKNEELIKMKTKILKNNKLLKRELHLAGIEARF